MRIKIKNKKLKCYKFHKVNYLNVWQNIIKDQSVTNK
jgi:hypothetical protein